MIEWILNHKDQVSGAIGATSAIIIDTANTYRESAFTKAILHDGNVIFVAVVLLTIKAAYGAFAGIIIGKMVERFSKKAG